MELGCDKFPAEQELYPEWRRNKEALLTFMESVSLREFSLPFPAPVPDLNAALLCVGAGPSGG